MMMNNTSSSSSNQSHEPPTLQSQQQQQQPFTLTQDNIRAAGLHVLTPQQQKRAVIVYDLSEDISIKQLSEFFAYCGGVEKIVLNQNQNQQLFSVVVLDNEAAFTTAILLNKAILNDQSITVAPYVDFVKQATGARSNSQSFSSQQSYLDHLQQKQGAYEKVISLISMGYVSSQQAVEDLKVKAQELDTQTQSIREQISTTAQPLVTTTKMTLETTTQKLQPIIGAAKEKTAQVTAPVLSTTKEKVVELKEKINSSQVWENETVKQGIAVTNAAKEGIVGASMGAWNAIKGSWLSFKGDVEEESNQLRSKTNPTRSSPTSEVPPVPESLVEQKRKSKEQAPVAADSYFTMDDNQDDLLVMSSPSSPTTTTSAPAENASHTTQDMEDEFEQHNLPAASTSYTLGSDDEGDEYGIVTPQSPQEN